MNYGHAIDPDRRFIFQVYEGHFSLEQVIACTQRLWADPAYCKSYHGIIDISRMCVSHDIAQVRTYISFLQQDPHTSNVRWATITSSPWLTACAMIYRTAMAERHPIEVFSTWSAATDYLHLNLPSPPAVSYFTDLPGNP
ncbi:MAG: hypothetical protein WC205_17395 [Opitutaceae bacterium]|jgi:hypothetical protein